MRLSERIEKPGFFWLPKDAQNKLPGILCISESGEITLTVNYFWDHGLDAHSGRSLEIAPLGWEKQNLNRIVGIIDSDRITLDECFQGKVNAYLGDGVSTATIHANRAFIGVNYGEGKEVTFSKLTFSVDGLDEWLAISGIKQEINREDWSVSIRYNSPKDIAFNLPNGMELKFTFQSSWPSFPLVTEAKITQKAYISLISKELRPIEDFLDLVFKLQNFLCFAIDKPVSIDSITGFSNEITREIEQKKKDEIPIKVYDPSRPYSETRPEIYSFHMIFSYEDVADQFEKILTKWLENYEISEPAFNLYFASMSGGHKYMESKFLSLVQGIETLHRRNSQEVQMPKKEFSNLKDEILKAISDDNKKSWIEEKLRYANELSLRKRLKQMLESFKDLFGNSKRRNAFIGKVVDTRNYFTHYDSSLESKAAGGTDLWNLSMKLEALFQLHFLRLIGIDANAIKSIVNENQNLRYKLGLE